MNVLMQLQSEKGKEARVIRRETDRIRRIPWNNFFLTARLSKWVLAESARLLEIQPLTHLCQP